MTLQNSVITRLAALGWSQIKLAHESGLRTTAVRDILNGKAQNPTLKTLRALAEALHITVSELIGEVQPSATSAPAEDREWLMMGRTVPPHQRAAVRQAIATIMLMGSTEYQRRAVTENEPAQPSARRGKTTVS